MQWDSETETESGLDPAVVFTSEFEQYRHARLTNAQVTAHEPHDLYRYTTSKYIEPGDTWLPYGAPDSREWMTDPAIGRALLRRAREVELATLTKSELRGQPLPDNPAQVRWPA